VPDWAIEVGTESVKLRTAETTDRVGLSSQRETFPASRDRLLFSFLTCSGWCDCCQASPPS
jgi:hypothetical protein